MGTIFTLCLGCCGCAMLIIFGIDVACELSIGSEVGNKKVRFNGHTPLGTHNQVQGSRAFTHRVS